MIVNQSADRLAGISNAAFPSTLWIISCIISRCKPQCKSSRTRCDCGPTVLLPTAASSTPPLPHPARAGEPLISLAAAPRPPPAVHDCFTPAPLSSRFLLPPSAAARSPLAAPSPFRLERHEFCSRSAATKVFHKSNDEGGHIDSTTNSIHLSWIKGAIMTLNTYAKKRFANLVGLAMVLVILTVSVGSGSETKASKADQHKTINTRRLARELPLAYDVMKRFGVFEALGLVDQLDKSSSKEQADDTYEMSVGHRQGRSSSKEQYTYVYRRARVSVTDSYDYDDGSADSESLSSSDDSVDEFICVNTIYLAGALTLNASRVHTWISQGLLKREVDIIKALQKSGLLEATLSELERFYFIRCEQFEH